MEHIATSLSKPSEEVKAVNLYEKGQTTHLGQVLEFCNIRDMQQQLMAAAGVEDRRQQVQQFNKVMATFTVKEYEAIA